MPDPRQFARPLRRKPLRYVAAGLLSTGLLFVGPAMAWADDLITLDFVRHGESGDMSVINTLVPGPELTPTGVDQAKAVADLLAPEGPYAGIYASEMIRTQETAAPLAGAPLDPDHILSGLNEIDAGIFEGAPVDVGDLPLGGALYLLAPFLWTLGLDFVPELGSTTDPNGIAFDESFSSAVQTIYDQTISNGDGNLTDVAFSSEGAMAVWTLMNVSNPDFPLVLEQLLTTGQLVPYTGTVVVQGDPDGGWTLVSWDGTSVPQDPGLPTDLFVDFRDLITAPQMAAYNIWEAILSGDAPTITDAIQTGVNEVSTATTQFPGAVIGDIVGALQNDIPGLNLGDLSADLLPTLATESTAPLSGEFGALIGEVLAAF